MKKTIFVLSLFLVLSGFTSKNQIRGFDKPLSTAEGQKIYEEMGCLNCHGHQGKGDGLLAGGLSPKPRNFTSYEEMSRLPYQSMYSAIKNGVSGTAMPAFDLSDEQINKVIYYVKSFLTKNYITVETCLNVPKIISLKNVDIAEKFNIEVNKKNTVLTEIKNGKLILTPDFVPLLKTLKKERKKLARVHVDLTRGEKEKKKYLAIVALRIRDCIK